MFITRIFYAIAYLVVFLVEIIKATVDVAGRTLNGKIDPVIVEIKTELKRPVSQTLLVSTLNLTPGSLTIDLDSKNQIMKIAVITPRSREELIPFEPYIKGMLE